MAVIAPFGHSHSFMEELGKRKRLLQEARDGHIEAIRSLNIDYSLKLYTREEVAVASLLRSGEAKLSPKVDISDRELTIDLMPFYGSEYEEPAQINWLQEIVDTPCYLAGVSYLSSNIKDCCLTWVLKLDKRHGFRQLFCADGWLQKEV